MDLVLYVTLCHRPALVAIFDVIEPLHVVCYSDIFSVEVYVGCGLQCEAEG